MDVNPYASPRDPSQWMDDPGLYAATGASGLWRDRNLLVVDLRSSSFPLRCVKTNRPVDRIDEPLKIDWIPHRLAWFLFLGVFGVMIARSLVGTQHLVRLPVCEEWLAKRKRAVRIGWAIIIGGIGGFVVITIGYVLAMLSGMPEKSADPIMFTALAMPAISLVGLVFLTARNQPILATRKVTERHAWLSKAHPDFLASLPEWPN